MGIIKFSSISFNNIKNEIERYLKTEHNKAGILYSPSSPYGQILNVIENLYQMSILYLKNAINQFDLSQPNSNNPRIIRNAAIYAGHIPTRSISATGTLKLTLKNDVEIDNDVPGGRITFFNKSELKNRTNALSYSMNIGVEKVTHKITPGYTFFIPIIQGKWKTKNFTGDGTELQTYSVQEISNKDIENFNFEVIVNGEVWDTRNSIWDMLPDEKSCVVRTGFNGGIDLIFGNGGFGAIPPITATIQFNYLCSDGSLGNIFRRTRNDWNFIDDVVSGDGQVVNLTELFEIDIFNDINFGSDYESLEFTKNIMPFVSTNFVLGLPQQYAYEIKKLGVFSHVNAYERTNTIFIVATPNIRLFKNRNADYFTIDIRAFELDRYEKSKIDKYLRTNGKIQLTRKYKIQSPILSYYVMNIYVIPYSDVTDDSIRVQILDKISEYFLDLRRVDRIPKLDLIKELSTIEDLHSVDIQFISKKNEDYHRENNKNYQNSVRNYDTSLNTDISIKPSVDYNPKQVLGLDPVLGDILFEPNELPIIRGGFYDRNGIYYSDDIESSLSKSVNIIKKGVVDSKNKIS